MQHKFFKYFVRRGMVLCQMEESLRLLQEKEENLWKWIINDYETLGVL